MSSSASHRRLVGCSVTVSAVTAVTLVLALADPAAAQRFGGRAGGLRGGLAGERGFGGRFEERGGFAGRLEGREGEGPLGGRLREQGAEGWREGGDGAAGGRFGRREGELGATQETGDGASRETRNGGTVEANKTTSGDTTTREATYTGQDGQSASHTGSVTKDDGSFSYSGSGSTSAGGSSSSSASGTYGDGRVQSTDTSISGTNASGESASHDGHWNRDGDSVSYSGSSSTSTGKWSDSAGQVTKTDDGFAAHGATVNSQGAASGTVVKDGDQVYGRSVTTDGDTVTRNRTTCTGGDCTRTSATTSVPTVQQYYAAPYYYYYPQYYAYYACPPGSMTVFTGAGGAVYSCGVTPVISTTIPLTAAMLAASKATKGRGEQPSTAQVTSSPVLMYRVASDTVVYATSYQPHGLYWEDVKDRYFWVPGAATASPEVTTAIAHARSMTTPTANATVITYTIGDQRVYLTNEAPLAGTYTERADVLYAWIPGVTKPSEAQRDAIATAVTAHEQAGAKALAGEVRKLEQGKPAPS